MAGNGCALHSDPAAPFILSPGPGHSTIWDLGRPRRFDVLRCGVLDPRLALGASWREHCGAHEVADGGFSGEPVLQLYVSLGREDQCPVTHVRRVSADTAIWELPGQRGLLAAGRILLSFSCSLRGQVATVDRTPSRHDPTVWTGDPPGARHVRVAWGGFNSVVLYWRGSEIWKDFARARAGRGSDCIDHNYGN